MKAPRISPKLQAWLPKHAISRLIGWFAESQNPWIKRTMVNAILKRYPVRMDEAIETDPLKYASFNDFFIRKLKPDLRPIDQNPAHLVSPVDGQIAEFGKIAETKMLQAKGHTFSLTDLLAGNKMEVARYINGAFMAVYLAPHNYHRVHVPYDAKLVATRFVPGKLFSVNQETANSIPNLYALNERLICFFEHPRLGSFAMVLVGAMIVGSIQLSDAKSPIRTSHLEALIITPSKSYRKGDELGYFKMGSTVVMVFEKNKLEWLTDIEAQGSVQLGMPIAKLN